MSSLHEEFVSITGASLDDALTWLEIGQYDLQNAVELFLSSNQNQTNTDHQNQNYVPKLNEFVDNDVVRMPDSVKRGRLMDETFMISNKAARPAVKSAFTSGSGFVPKNEKERTLADIYKPPVDLMVMDTFDGVLEMAKQKDQWLLINVQRDTEFQCHLLNRDFWGDESVRDMVLSSFVFWQQQETSDGGAHYVERYKVTNFPHISIVDPRTGASVWRHDGAFEKALLAERLQDFLGTQSCPSESRIGGRLMRKLTGGGSSSSSSSQTAPAASEEEELEEAIRMSLRREGGTEEESTSIPVAVESSVTEVVAPMIVTQSGFSVAELSRLNICDAPADEIGLVKTVFRLPRGGKVMRSFASSAPLKDVAIFAAHQIVAADASSASDGARFEASFNFPQVLLSGVTNFDTQSLQSAGIVTGSAIVVKML